MDVAARRGPPGRPLRCRTAASRAGQVPAPGRWRGAIRRASFDSPSQLPLFNQIIGKVNLLDSRALQPPPFPRSPPAARAAHARLPRAPLRPDAVLPRRTKGEAPWIFLFERGTKGSCQRLSGFSLPPLFILFLFLLFFFFFLLYFTNPPVSSHSIDAHKLLSTPPSPRRVRPPASGARNSEPGALNPPSSQGSCSEKQEWGLPAENEATYLIAITGAFQSFFFFYEKTPIFYSPTKKMEKFVVFWPVREIENSFASSCRVRMRGWRELPGCGEEKLGAGFLSKESCVFQAGLAERARHPCTPRCFRVYLKKKNQTVSE